MDKPLPPVVQGPITPFSPVVRVTGALQGAQVSVLQGALVLGHATAVVNGDMDVPLGGNKPVIGQPVTAKQEIGGLASDPDPYGVVVVDTPKPLPMPTVESTLQTCMADVLADNLVQGATVYADIGGQPFAKVVAQQCRQWLSIDPVAAIASGSQLTVRQELDVGGGVMLTSAPFVSLPIPNWHRDEQGLPPPKLGTSLQACDTSIQFIDVTGGASTSIDNEGMSEAYVNPTNAYLGIGSQPLRKGKLIAQQMMPRCGLESLKATFNVDPPSPPSKPTGIDHICPDAARISLATLTPGAVLHMRRRIDWSSSSSSFDNYSDIGVGKPEQDIDLPASIPLTDPPYPVSLEFWQERCGQLGLGTLQVPVQVPAAHHGAPSIKDPAYECTRGLRIQGASPGALLQAFDYSTGAPLSDMKPVPVSDFVMFLWWSLHAGQKVWVKQIGCNATGDSNVVSVQASPNPLPKPVLKKPRPGATSVTLSQVVPGGSVQLLIRGVARTPEVTVWEDPFVLHVFGPALADGDDVLPVQRLCAVLSQHEGLGTPVTKGRLGLTVTPSKVTTGTTTNLTVTARDTETGDSVLGTVTLNRKNVGMTGTPFAFSPKTGDPPPAGVVSAPPGYFDEPFTITLVAPAAPTWTMTFHASPKRRFVDSAIFDLSAAHFEVVADWDASLKRTVLASPTTTSPELVGSTSIPAPTGAPNTVTVQAWVDWSGAGGNVNGVYVYPASGASAKLTFKINHNAASHNAYVVATPQVADESHYFMDVVFGSISP